MATHRAVEGDCLGHGAVVRAKQLDKRHEVRRWRGARANGEGEAAFDQGRGGGVEGARLKGWLSTNRSGARLHSWIMSSSRKDEVDEPTMTSVGSASSI